MGTQPIWSWSEFNLFFWGVLWIAYCRHQSHNGVWLDLQTPSHAQGEHVWMLLISDQRKLCQPSSTKLLLAIGHVLQVFRFPFQTSNKNGNLIYKVWITVIKFPLKLPLAKWLNASKWFGGLCELTAFLCFCDQHIIILPVSPTFKLGRLVDCIGKTEQKKTSEAFIRLWSAESFGEERLFEELSEVRGNTVWDLNSSCVFCFHGHPR